jgi:hypothetical protein
VLQKEKEQMGRAELTAERLRELLRYDWETGKFTRRTTTGNFSRYKIGSVAGSVTVVTGYREIWVEKHLYLAHRFG